MSKNSSVLPFKWPIAYPNAFQSQSQCNVTSKTWPRIYALGATSFPPRWNSSSNQQATNPCTMLYYHLFLNCSACSVCRFPPPLTDRQTDHSSNTGQLLWTSHEQGARHSLATLSRANDAEQKIKSASPSIKKYLDDLGVWRT